MNKLVKKIALNTGLKNSTYFWSKILGCLSMEVYIGDYKYCNADPCLYTAIIGNADFSECQNVQAPKLKYVIDGNLNVSGSNNLSFPTLKKVDGSVFAVNSFGLNLCKLEASKSMYIEESILKSLENLTSGHLFIKNSIIENQNPYMKFLNKYDKGCKAEQEITK